MTKITKLVATAGLAALAAADMPAYDGKLRTADSDGRLDAYMAVPCPSSHASFVETLGADGAIAVAWFCGEGEGQDLVSILISILPGGAAEGASFTAPQVVSQREGYSNQNPVLYFEPGASTLHLLHNSQEANANESTSTVWYLSAPAEAVAAGGGQWTKPVQVLPVPSSFVRNRVQLTLNGDWLLPMYYSNHTAAGRHV